MHKLKLTLITLAFSLTQCTSAGGSRAPGEPTSTPALPAKEPVRLASGPWSFQPFSGSQTYRSISKTTLQPSSDPHQDQDTGLIAMQFTIRLDQFQIPAALSGQIDSLLITPGSRVGTNLGRINLPIKFKGTITEGKLSLSLESGPPTQPQSYKCLDPAITLLGEIRSQTLLLPLHLSAGSAWSDTITTVACSGTNVLSRTKTVRTYTVPGEVNRIGHRVLLIERAENIDLTGSGSQGQHQITLAGEGQGISKIYLNLTTGLPFTIQSRQNLRVTITSSGRIQSFVQTVEQQIDFLR